MPKRKSSVLLCTICCEQTCTVSYVCELHECCWTCFVDGLIKTKSFECPFCHKQPPNDGEWTKQILARALSTDDNALVQTTLSFVESKNLCQEYTQCGGCHSHFWTDGNCPQGECPKCNKQICSSCGQEPHTGHCKRISEDIQNAKKEILEVIGTENAKECISCSTILEKSGGCSHFQCKNCLAEFCWECQENWHWTHPAYTCKQMVRPQTFANFTEYGNYFIKRSWNLKFHEGELAYFLSGITAFANSIVQNECMDIDHICKIFGIRKREFPLQQPLQSAPRTTEQSFVSFVHLQCKLAAAYSILQRNVTKQVTTDECQKVLTRILKDELRIEIFKLSPLNDLKKYMKGKNLDQKTFTTRHALDWLVNSFLPIATSDTESLLRLSESYFARALSLNEGS